MNMSDMLMMSKNDKRIKYLQSIADRYDEKYGNRAGEIKRVNLKVEKGFSYFGQFWINWDRPLDLQYFDTLSIQLTDGDNRRYQEYTWVTIGMGSSQYTQVWFPVMVGDYQLPYCPISKQVSCALINSDIHGVIGVSCTSQMLLRNAETDNG